jgi:universal stress protein E
MRRFKKILVHVHVEADQQPALKRAAELATHNHAELTLVALVEPLPWHLRDGIPREIEAERLDDCQSGLEKLATSIRAQGLTVNTKILQENGNFELIREVLRGRHELVMKVADGKVSRRDMFHSTLDQRLLRKCPCPVWLFPPTGSSRFERILAAVDAAPDDAGHGLLNPTVLELASSLQTSENAELHIVHAWDIPDEGRLLARLGDKAFQTLVNSSQASIDQALNRLLARHAVAAVPERVHLMKGEPHAVILKMVEQQEIDLLIMGSIARTGISGRLIGNTAERVLNAVGCSVLTVKPSDFVSPVALG